MFGERGVLSRREARSRHEHPHDGRRHHQPAHGRIQRASEQVRSDGAATVADSRHPPARQEQSGGAELPQAQTRSDPQSGRRGEAGARAQDPAQQGARLPGGRKSPDQGSFRPALPARVPVAARSRRSALLALRVQSAAVGRREHPARAQGCNCVPQRCSSQSHCPARRSSAAVASTVARSHRHRTQRQRHPSRSAQENSRSQEPTLNPQSSIQFNALNCVENHKKR